MTFIQWKDSVQNRIAHIKHGITGRSLFLHQKDGCALEEMRI